MRRMGLFSSKDLLSSSRSFSIFSSIPHSAALKVPYINHDGKLAYVLDGSPFPYFTPRELIAQPADISKYKFNRYPIDKKKNPFGKVTELCNHDVYRAQAPSGEVVYLKDLSHSRVGGARREEDAQFLAYQESFANWLMVQLFGPRLIPYVYPIKFNNIWGIASSEIRYDGTLYQLAEGAGFGDLEIQYGASAIEVRAGKTYLVQKDKQEEVRVMGRIALKVALRMLTAHDDIESHSKNCFMVLVDDPMHSRRVACPGIFDLGCVFHPQLMKDFIDAWKDDKKKEELVQFLAVNAVDAHIKELNIDDYEKIKHRLYHKFNAFKRIAELPWENVEKGLQWFKAGVREEQRAHIDTIGRYLACVKEISLAVESYIAKMIIKARSFDESAESTLSLPSPILKR